MSQEPIKVSGPLCKPELPPLYSLWSHARTGNVYKVVGYSNLYAKNTHTFPLMVRYEDDEGREWCRPLSDWHRVFTPATTETWQ